MSTLKIIKQPECQNDFLRFIIGVNDKRPAKIMVKDKEGEVKYVTANWDVPILNVLGFGSTLDLAQRMANKRAKELGIRI